MFFRNVTITVEIGPKAEALAKAYIALLPRPNAMTQAETDAITAVLTQEAATLKGFRNDPNLPSTPPGPPPGAETTGRPLY